MVTGTRLATRLVKLFGKPIKLAHRGLTHVFPRPETLAEADLSRIGLSPRQAAAIRDLASAATTGALSLEALPDSGDALPRLCAIPGIDRGTAQYIAMRGLGEPDTFPITEIGLRRVLARGGTPFSAAALECLAETWRPWRAYAAMHLWSAHNCRREGTADMH